MPKISVIMPAYNSQEYIKESVNSIINQTFGDFELIIIDDGSSDDTLEILNSMKDSRIKVIVNENNMGVAATLNRGLKLAQGEYIARMDSDDIALPERFQKQYDYMDAHKDCIMCGSNMKFIGARTGKTQVPITDKQIRATVIFSSPFAHPTVMMRKSIIDENKLNYSVEYEGVEDYALWAKMMNCKGTFYNFEEPLLNYRFHPNQVTQTQPSPKRLIILNELHKYIFDIYKLGSQDEFPVFFEKTSENNLVWTEWRINHFFEESKKIIERCPPELRQIINIYLNSIFLEIFRSCSGMQILMCIKRYNNIITLSARNLISVLLIFCKKIIDGNKTKKEIKRKSLENRKKLKKTNFSIISNNCWGGLISQKYGLPYNSPTCGLLILGEDYIKFCKNLEYYISQNLNFISWEESKHHELYPKMRFPVAKLDDIEIYFMHYSTEEEAAEKWNRRVERLNTDMLIFKISEREDMTEKEIKEFTNLPLKNKLIFASKKYSEDTIVVKDINVMHGDEFPIIEKIFDEAEYINSL